MKHLNRDQSFQTVKIAISKDHPEVADGMERMADCVSAATQIISSQMGEAASLNPQYVIPMAMEMFQDSSASQNNDEGDEVVEDRKTHARRLEEKGLDILEVMSDREWEPDELTEALKEKWGTDELNLLERKALMVLISNNKVKVTKTLGYQRMMSK